MMMNNSGCLRTNKQCEGTWCFKLQLVGDAVQRPLQRSHIAKCGGSYSVTSR